MKKIRPLALILALLMVASMVGCGGQKQENTPPAAVAPEVQDAEIVPDTITLINCRVADETAIPADGMSHVARAVLPDGMAVDHWEINGEEIDSGGRVYSTQFNADFEGTLKAVLHPEKTVTCINACIQLLNEDGVPAGKRYTKYVFEYSYPNPDETDHAGGSISFKVSADVPKGYEVDYWIINGAAHFFDTALRSFTVVGLDDSRCYELVLKPAGTAGTTLGSGNADSSGTSVPVPDLDLGFSPPEWEPPFGIEEEPDLPYGHENEPDPDADLPYGAEDDPLLTDIPHGPGNPDTEEWEGDPESLDGPSDGIGTWKDDSGLYSDGWNSGGSGVGSVPVGTIPSGGNVSVVFPVG